jgi:hypothetical protein
VVRVFRPEHLAEVNRWYTARGLPQVPASALPSTGRIVPGVASGFLYRTDSDLALLEGYVSNPEAPLRARARAFDGIVAALIEEAKAGGARRVVAFCASEGVRRRAARLALEHVGTYSLVAREV